MSQQNRDVGKRLRKVRGEMTQNHFAELIGVHQNTLGAYERGEREVSATAITGILGMGVSPVWILTGEGDENGLISTPKTLQDTQATPAAARLLNALRAFSFADAESWSKAERQQAEMLVEMLVHHWLPTIDETEQKP